MPCTIAIQSLLFTQAESVLSYSDFRLTARKWRRDLTDKRFAFADTGAVYPLAARASPIVRHVENPPRHRSSLRGMRRILGRSQCAGRAADGVHEHRQLVG